MKVYYNSGCPVCKAGIESQMSKNSVCEFQWQDVHSENELADDLDSELEFIRERLHAKDDAGNVYIGFDAVLAIWRNTQRERWLASIFGLPVIKQLARLGYNGFAWCLYRWNRSRKHW